MGSLRAAESTESHTRSTVLLSHAHDPCPMDHEERFEATSSLIIINSQDLVKKHQRVSRWHSPSVPSPIQPSHAFEGFGKLAAKFKGHSRVRIWALKKKIKSEIILWPGPFTVEKVSYCYGGIPFLSNWENIIVTERFLSYFTLLSHLRIQRSYKYHYHSPFIDEALREAKKHA